MPGSGSSKAVRSRCNVAVRAAAVAAKEAGPDLDLAKASSKPLYFVLHLKRVALAAAKATNFPFVSLEYIFMTCVSQRRWSHWETECLSSPRKSQM